VIKLNQKKVEKKMNKNLFVCLFVFAFIICLNGVFAADIAYLVDNAGSLDNSETTVRDFLIAESYSVDVLEGSFNPADYLAIVVSESVDSINFDNKEYRTLFMSRSAAKNVGIVDSSGLSSTRDIEINRIDEITQNYPLGDLRVYDDQSVVHYIKSPFPSNHINLAFKSDSYKSVLLGLKLNSDYHERNVYFGMIQSEEWNNDGENLFRRSVEWLLGSGSICVDGDSDSYDNCAIGSPADDGLPIDCDDGDDTIFPGNSDPIKDCVNEAPIIDTFLPNIASPHIIENLDRTFSIAISDVDNDLTDLSISWTLDNVDVGTGGVYTFNQPQGNYEVKVVVSDGELDTEQIWSVTVGSVGDFTCTQVGGNICTGEQVCEGDLLDVIDSNSCCAIACVDSPPEFEKINNQCEIKNNNIEINFENVDSNEEFDIFDLISSRIKVKNELGEDYDFEITKYFYDLTENKVIEKQKDDLDIEDGRFQVKDFEFLVEGDLDEGNNYAFFVIVESENDECNQNYVNIDIKRKENHVIIDDFNLFENYFVCGDTIRGEVDLQNIGSDDQDVTLKIKNSKLKVNEEISPIEIEKYGDDDSVSKDITFQIPDNSGAGEYVLIAEVYYDGNDYHRFEKSITLQECKESVIDEEQIDTIKLLGKVSEVSDETSKKPWYKMLSLYILIIVIIGVAVFLVYYYWDEKYWLYVKKTFKK
jgi:hypothetical protein